MKKYLIVTILFFCVAGAESQGLSTYNNPVLRAGDFRANSSDVNYLAAGSRNNGIAFKEQWARARLLGVRFAMVGIWNEWVKGEQLSADVSKDIEPNNVWGDQYLLLLKSGIKKFKGVH